MNTLHPFKLVSALLLGTFLCVQRAQAVSTMADDRVLTGEFVVTDAAHNRFRLVGHAGSFIAPAGVPVDVLDGKPVEVELTRAGRVLRVSEMPIHIEPITHGYEVITGQLEVMDAVTRTFTIAGTNRIYVAPLHIDVRPYAGRMVDVHLDENGQVTEIALGDAPATSACSYDGQRYASGALVCQSGTQYHCQNGQWRSRGTTCAWDGAAVSRWPRSCLVGDAALAEGSIICRSGTTFRCMDGAWSAVGTVC